MARTKYLNADETKGIIQGLMYHSGKSTITREALEGIIDNVIPSADVVEIVRCKDCKNCKKVDGQEMWCEGRGYPSQIVSPEGFCDRGK